MELDFKTDAETQSLRRLTFRKAIDKIIFYQYTYTDIEPVCRRILILESA